MVSATASFTPSPALPTGSPTAALALANVLYEKKGAIAYVTVNRPKVLNALNTPTWKDLRTAFEDAQRRRVRTRRHPHRRRRQGFHRRRRHQRARACRRRSMRSSPAASDRMCSISSRISASRWSRRSTALRSAAAARRRWPAPSGSRSRPRNSANPRSSSDLFPAAAARNDCRGWSARVARCSSFCPARRSARRKPIASGSSTRSFRPRI